MNTPTFEQFQASRVASDNLGQASDVIAPEWFLDENGNERAAAGFIYDGDCYIEQLPDGRYYLTIFNEETISETLEPLERALYEWVVSEGLFN